MYLIKENYISCGWKVKSEIVIPIFVNKENIGQIDIDSHTANVFTDKDEQLPNFFIFFNEYRDNI